MILRGFYRVDPKRASKVRSVFTSLPWELAYFHFRTTLTMPAQHRWVEKEGVLWPERVRYAFDQNNMLTFWDFSQYENTVEPHLQSCIKLRVIPYIGRLGMALEGAGKRRIFAIGNYRPKDTDRWPLLFLTDVVKILFGEAWAKGVVNSTLATGRLAELVIASWLDSIRRHLDVFVRSEIKLKDLKLAPHDFDPYSEDRDLVEYTAVRSDSGYSMYAGTTCFEGFTPKVGLNQLAAGRGVVYPGVTIISGNTPKTTVTY
ncbi:hypothetical protein BUALT_Bualt15G0138800 [Buddleja alternifolia]|uniref:Uncharacterized protein n=1 Tax=Buddleja alternifolia TaxID=168488 RepID=A0AAV6WGJ7_9LAMI|nr:hypothetical protein BUALT_Bualt15G0138800 [Buddleja alternifolia]